MRSTLLLLLAIAPLSGCLDAITGAFSEEDPPVAPGPFEFQGLISPQLRRSENFTVPPRMAALDLDAELLTAGSPNNQLPTPAQVTVQIFNSGGQAVGERRTLNPQTPRGAIEITRPVPDAYEVRIEGMGLSGNGQGASYRITVTLTAEA